MSEPVKIGFRQPDGRVVEVEAATGQSVMQAAIFNNVDGIEAECGGSCMCATCHVYVEAAGSGEIAPPSEEEDEMLEDAAAERRPASRLSCQIPVTAELAGAVFELPERQL